MRKFISFAVALAVILALPGVAQAKKTDKPLEGKVTAVDTTANTITVAKGKKDSQVFKAAGATVTVDGAAAKLSDITIGMKATVTVGATADTATAIAATTHKKGGKKNKNAAPTPTPAST